MNPDAVILGSVQETMLMPLWGRAVETQKERPLLIDWKAKEIIEDLPYDFSAIAKNIDPLTRAAWIARSLYFDKELLEFQNGHPNCSIINIGCGLDTTYDRVSIPESTWYEIDLPDVIQLRRKYIPESDRRIFLAGSVFEDAWYSRIHAAQDVLMLFAGVLYYFEEEEVKSLFRKSVQRFGKADMLFDYCSRKGLEITNKVVIEKAGMKKDAFLKWSIEDIHELENWDMPVRVVHAMAMFEEFKKNYPPEKQTGMDIADKMKIMALAHIELGAASPSV